MAVPVLPLKMIWDSRVYSSHFLRADHMPARRFTLSIWTSTASTIFVFCEKKTSLRTSAWVFVLGFTVAWSSRRIEFVCDPSEPLEGTIARLTLGCGGNVHDKRVVNVAASTVYNNRQPRNVADLGTDSFYFSNNGKDTWICYDFRERRVVPTRYSVRSSPYRSISSLGSSKLQTTSPRGRELIVETITTTWTTFTWIGTSRFPRFQAKASASSV